MAAENRVKWFRYGLLYSGGAKSVVEYSIKKQSVNSIKYNRRAYILLWICALTIYFLIQLVGAYI